MRYKEIYEFLRQSCELLNIQIFESATPPPGHKKTILGCFDGLFNNNTPSDGIIWIRAGIKIKERCICLSHELFHALEHISGKKHDYNTSESLADHFSLILIGSLTNQKFIKYMTYRNIIIEDFFSILRIKIAEKQYKCSDTADFWRGLGVDI